jgi:hypothetical protein
LVAPVVLGRPQFVVIGEGRAIHARVWTSSLFKNPECNKSVLFNFAALVAHLDHKYALSWIEWGPLLICGDAPCALVKNP